MVAKWPRADVLPCVFGCKRSPADLFGRYHWAQHAHGANAKFRVRSGVVWPIKIEPRSNGALSVINYEYNKIKRG